MNKEISKATVLWTLLILVLAGLGFTPGPAQAATMASFTALPSLNAQVDRPTALAVDGQGRVYVAESMNNEVRIFSQSGSLQTTLSGLAKPTSVAVDGAGKIYVGNAMLGNVTIYGSDLTVQRKLGSGNGEFGEPADIDIDAAGQVYVTDRDKNTIGVYSASGQKVKSIGTAGSGDGQLNHPTSLAIDPVASELVVVDQQQSWDSYAKSMFDGARIQYFNTEGGFLRGYTKFGYNMTGGQLVRPQQVAVDASGRVYVTDARLQKVMVYDHVNTFLGMMDNSAAPLRTTLGMSMAPSGRLYVASLLAGRVDVFGVDNYAAMGVAPAALSFTATEGGAAPVQQSATVRNSGKAEVTWSASTTAPWLSVPTAGGTLPPSAAGTVAVGVQTQGLTAGTYQGNVKVAAPGMEEVVAVTLTVSAAPPPPPPVDPPPPPAIDAPALPLPGAGGVTAGGKMWNVSQPAAGVSLRGVWGSGSKNAVVVGDGGTIFRFDGKSWKKATSGTDVALHGVFGSATESTYDVYAVGAAGQALHFNGTAWAPVTTDSTETLEDVSIAGSEILVVGSNGAVLNLSRGTADAAAIGLHSIWSSAADVIIAVGESGTVLHHDGTAWTDMGSGTSQMLNAVWGSSATDVFAVGESGTIVHYDGTTWSTMDSGVIETLQGVYGDSPSNVYAVGDNAMLLHYDGNTWTVLIAGGVNLRDVWTAEGTVVVAGDDGTILTGRASAKRKGGGKPILTPKGSPKHGATDPVVVSPERKGPTTN